MSSHARLIAIVVGVVATLAFLFGWLAGRGSDDEERPSRAPVWDDDAARGETAEEEAPLDPESTVDSLVELYPDIVIVDAPLRLEGSADVHPEPDDSTEPIGHLERGTTVYHVGKLEDWSLIGWPERDPSAYGWIVPPAAPPPAPEEPAESDTGVIRGTASFVGTVPVMRVPAKRKRAEHCKNEEIAHNAVRVSGGRLADVMVRLQGVKGAWQPPEAAGLLAVRSCVMSPRVQGLLVGQSLEIVNEDPILHGARAHKGSTALFNEPLTKTAPAAQKTFFEEAILRITCDVHPWERAFVFVSDHPFFDVTGESGAFHLTDVPAGSYTVEAWHSRFGKKRQANVLVSRGRPTELSFTFRSSDRPPPENRDESRALR